MSGLGDVDRHVLLALDGRFDLTVRILSVAAVD
jgi:hypothetical protein